MQTRVEEVENAEYVSPLKPLLSMRVQDPADEELDPLSRLREYVDSERRLVAKKLCYAKLTRRSWPLKHGCRGDLSQLDSGHARQATVKCGRERQEGDRVATGRRQGGDRKTTGKRQESGREATGSDRQATGRRQGRCDRRATGGRQGGDRMATGRRQGSDRKQDIATG